MHRLFRRAKGAAELVQEWQAIVAERGSANTVIGGALHAGVPFILAESVPGSDRALEVVPSAILR